MSTTPGDPLPPPVAVPRPPDGDPDFLPYTWASYTHFMRVGLDPYAGDEPYVSPEPTRFSPFADRAGRPVPVLYGADQTVGALSETVFHDVPVRGVVRSVKFDDLFDRFLVRITPTRDLALADFTRLGLSRIGVERMEMIESGPSGCPVTAEWAERVHRDWRNFDGITWMSRQDDTSRAVVLFGDRVSANRHLRPVDARDRSFLIAPGTFDTVARLADQVGITISGLPPMR